MLVLVALLAPLLAPYDPLAQNLYARLQPPSASHWLGTDDFGRDIFSRIVYGARISLADRTSRHRVSRFRRHLTRPRSRVSRRDCRHAHHAADGPDAGVFPSILLAIAIVAVIGPGIDNAILAVSIVLVPQFARLMRSSVLTVREATYVEAARALGASESRLLFYSILPNCTVPLIVQATLSLGTAILDAAGLSFLGLGGPAADPRVGSHAIRRARTAPASALGHGPFPGLAIFVVVLALNLFGDGLRDALDPKI